MQIAFGSGSCYDFHCFQISFSFKSWQSNADTMKLSTFSDDHAEPRLLRQALPLFFVLAGAALLLATTVGAAVSLTVSPSLITNDFVGKVTLTIAGLSAGASVRVEKIADLNTNGVADAGEPVFRSLIVTDGQKPVLCGLANLNVAAMARSKRFCTFRALTMRLTGRPANSSTRFPIPPTELN